MKIPCVVLAMLCATTFARAGEIHHYENMTAREIEALDAAEAVVIVPGGILEQHGPYLPAGTDTLMSEHVTQRLAEAIASNTNRDVVLLPLLYLGTDGANRIGGRAVFPGTLTVQPETLRQVYMDLGDALGEAGFRNIFLMHIHGSPIQNRMLDMATDYFNDTWDGRMLHLYGLMPIQSQWRAARDAMSEEAVEAQGISVHSSAAEHSTILYLDPELVADDLGDAPDWRADSFPGMFALAHKPGWPGYLGAPRYASTEAGKAVMDALANASIEISLDVLGGEKLDSYPRFSESPQARNAPDFDNAPQRLRQADWLKAAMKQGEHADAEGKAK